jgi:hypothetical protein
MLPDLVQIEDDTKDGQNMAQCQGTAQQRALWEVPQYMEQPEALRAWSVARARRVCQAQSPSRGPKTSNNIGGEGTDGCSW